MGEPPARGDELRVFVVDDNPHVRDMVSLWINQCSGMTIAGCACNGAQALDLVPARHPDVVLMDVEMPGISGPEATERLLERCPGMRVVAYTGSVESEAVTRMIVAGARAYAVKGDDPRRLEHAIRAAAAGDVDVDPQAFPGLFDGVVQLAQEEHSRRVDAERLNDQLERSYRETVSALAAALDMRDTATQHHVNRVAGWAVAVGRKLGIEGQDLVDLEYGAIFHDVGKIGVPDSILKSPNRLSDEEWEIVRKHTIFGEQIIEPIGFLRNVARIVRHSHEHWDGSGYPDQLHGEQIPLASRIVLACDAFDVMTEGRRYKPALSHAVAAAGMRRDSGRNFDPRVVEALMEVLHEQGVLVEEQGVLVEEQGGDARHGDALPGAAGRQA